MSTAGPALAARGLAKQFGPIPALYPTDLSVAAGELAVVLGPNGAGKTTLLRLLAGLARPSAGSIEFGDPGAPRDRRQSRARVGLVAHQTHLYAALTARENLRLAARLHGLRDPAGHAARALAELELEPVAERPAGAVSRGIAQRIAIARALVHDPPILLLDEPFAGLDVRAAERLEARLRTLRSAGRALVLVTHDLSRAAALGDHGLLLVRGRASPLGPELMGDRAALERRYRAGLGAPDEARRVAS